MPPKKDEKKAEPALPPEPKDDMPLLLDCLKGTKDKVSRLQSALWLAQMAMASEEKRTNISTVILPIVNTALAAAHSTEVGSICTLVKVLLVVPDFGDAILASKLIPVLVGLIQNGTTTTRHSVAAIVTSIANQPVLRYRLTKELSLPAVVFIVGDDSADRVVRAAMMQCLRSAFIVAATLDAGVTSSPIVQQDVMDAVIRYLRSGGDNADGALFVLSQLRWTPEQMTAFLRIDGLSLLRDSLTNPKATYEGRGYAAETIFKMIGKPTLPQPIEGALGTAGAAAASMMAPGSAATGPGGTAEGKRGESSGGTRKTASPGAGAARGGSAKGKKGELKPPKGPPRGPYSMHAEDEPPMVREMRRLSGAAYELIRLGVVKLLADLLTPPAQEEAADGARALPPGKGKDKKKAGKKGKVVIPRPVIRVLRAALGALRHLVVDVKAMGELQDCGGLNAVAKWFEAEDAMVRRSAVAVMSLMGSEERALETMEMVGAPAEFHNVMPNGKPRALLMSLDTLNEGPKRVPIAGAMTAIFPKPGLITAVPEDIAALSDIIATPTPATPAGARGFGLPAEEDELTATTSAAGGAFPVDDTGHKVGELGDTAAAAIPV